MGFLFVCGDNFANLHFRVAEADGALLVLEVNGHLGTVVQATETTLTTIEEYGTLVANVDVVAGADFGAGAATDTILVHDVPLRLVVGYLCFTEGMIDTVNHAVVEVGFADKRTAAVDVGNDFGEVPPNILLG